MNSVEYIYYCLIISGIFIVIITLGLSSVVGYIVGYSFIVSGFILLAGYLLFKLSNKSDVSSIIFNIGPIIAIIGVITYYLSRITDGNISQTYYSFSNLFLTLVLVQSWVFYGALKDKQFQETKTMNRLYSSALYLLSLINVLIVISVHIILAYFSTDG
jgi:uncharacterized membrane protein